MFGATKTVAKILMGDSVAPMPSTEEGKKKVQSAPLDGERTCMDSRRKDLSWFFAPHLCKKEGKPELCLKSSLEKPFMDGSLLDVPAGESKSVQRKDQCGEELVEIMEFEFSFIGEHMASIKVSTLLLTYAFIAVFLHPFLCQGSTMKMMTATNEAGVATSDGKMIDQGIAYLLMMVALLITYLLH